MHICPHRVSQPREFEMALDTCVEVTESSLSCLVLQ